MPFKKVVRATEKDESKGPKDLRSVLTQKISGVLPKLRRVIIKRRRGTKWVDLIQELDGIEWAEGALEDREVLSAEMAEQLVTWAHEDAGDKKWTYQFVGLAEPLPGKDAGVLFELEHTLSPEDDDDAPLSRAGETTFIIKACRELVTGVSGEFVKVLKETNNLIRANADTSKALGDALANSDGKRWEVELKRMDLQYQADLFGAQALLGRERSINFHETVRQGFKTVGPILEVLMELVADQPINNTPPTEDEIKIVFKQHPTLCKLALEFVAETDATKKEELAAAIVVEWEGIGQNAQATIVINAKKDLGTLRMAKLAAWLKRVMGEGAKK